MKLAGFLILCLSCRSVLAFIFITYEINTKNGSPSSKTLLTHTTKLAENLQRSKVQKFNFSSTLVNSQLVCLLPVGILNHVMFIYHYLFTLVLKSPDGEWPITYIIIIIYVN